MTTYRLFKSPTGDIVRVKMGFSWEAFFVGSLKAVVRRVWLLFAIAFVAYLSYAYVSGTPSASTRTTAIAVVVLGFYVLYMTFCGVHGNRWLGESLRRRGYTLVGEERGRPVEPRSPGRRAVGRS